MVQKRLNMKYKLIKLEEDYYIISNEYIFVGVGVAEKLNDGKWMVMTIHNENDIDFKNQMKIIASTRTDLINSPITGLIYFEKEEIEDHLKHFINGHDAWRDLRYMGLSSDQCSEICDYIEKYYVLKSKEEDKFEWDIDMEIIPAKNILNSGAFDIIKFNKIIC